MGAVSDFKDRLTDGDMLTLCATWVLGFALFLLTFLVAANSVEIRLHFELTGDFERRE